MEFIVYAVIGGLAQLIDGSIGMGFGMVSSTILISIGTSAALASSAIHFAEIGTTLASGTAHWSRGNVESKLLLRLAVPGGIGAFLGAVLLSNLSTASANNFISVVLLVLGALLLIRFLLGKNFAITKSRKHFPLTGLVAGFLDASGGGGWGPITTPVLMTTSDIPPRKVVGTVSASEFIVALSASAGFLLNIDKIGFSLEVVLGLAIGGMLAAPVAARFVSRVSAPALGVLIAIAIILINGYRLIS